MNYLALAFAAAMALFFPADPVSAEGVAEQQARFGQITGNVQLLTQGSANWVDAHIDLPLETGDLISVDEDSEAEISIAKNVLIVLKGDSEAVMEHTTTQKGHLTLSRGVLLGRVEAANGSTGPWEFETPMGLSVVHGAEFALTHADAQGTHLAVTRGAVELTPAESATEHFPSVYINVHEEGILEKQKPLKKMNVYSPQMRASVAQLVSFGKRFQQVSNVWVPLTPAYRLELRRKYVAEVKPHKAPRRNRIPRKVSH